MSEYIFKMPDLGEGTVEAEIVAWHVKSGDAVNEDQVIAEIMTDKASVEVPSPVTGTVKSVSGAAGDKVRVGAPLIVFDTQTAHEAAPAVTAGEAPNVPAGGIREAARGPAAAENEQAGKPSAADPEPAREPTAAGRVMASPATRRRAREAGIDLGSVAGSGPGGRILRDDLAPAAMVSAATHRESTAADGSPATTEIKVIGVRRLIAERMSESKRNIPHFAYVEEVDVTELERLRQHLNSKLAAGRVSLTYLPLVVMALTRTLESFPQCNALYDAARGVIVRHRAVHVGIATQTPDGLKVPVVRDAGIQDLWQLAAEIRAVAERARLNQSPRTELVGSTITVTSLGKLGGIASTPVINSPEVAIIGLNKAAERPVIFEGVVTARRIMNISSSFDHRFVDGFDAAAMIQALKEKLEHPAAIFIS